METMCKPCNEETKNYELQEIPSVNLCSIPTIPEKPLIQTRTTETVYEEYDCLSNIALSMVTDKFCKTPPSCKG